LLPGGWFLLVVGLSYGAAFALAPDAALSALARLGPLLGGMLPALGVVFALLFLGELFLEPELVERHLGPDAGMRGWGLAIAGGVLSMGPMVAWLPLLAALRRRGTAPGLIALPVMVHYFGLRYTALLVGALLAGAVVNGALTGRLAGALPHNTASDARGRG
jgi:hypothetical protein